MSSKYMGAIGTTTNVARLWRIFKPTRTRSFTNINPNGTMDVVPGGLFNSEDVLTTKVLGAGIGETDWWVNGLNWREIGYGFFFHIFGDSVEMRTNLEIHSFVSTISSLAFYNSNFNWTQNLNRNLVCTDEIPFDSYYGPRNNDQHTSFTQESVDWLLAELGGPGVPPAPQPPTIYLDPEDMNGPTIICSTDTVTYSFGNCESAPVIEWEISNNLQVVTPLTSSYYSITVKPVHTTTNGPAYIKAIFASPNSFVQKDIWIGTPRVDLVKQVNVLQTGHTMPIAPINDCNDFGLKLNILPSFTNVQAIEWEKVTTNYLWSQNPPGYNDPYVIIAPECNGSITFKVRLQNDCGWSDWIQVEYEVSQCLSDCGSGGGGGGIITSDFFIIFPVPVETILHVNLIGSDPTDLLLAGQTLKIQLFNSSGVMVKNINAISCQNSMDVSALPTGNYVLTIIYDGLPESHQIIII